MAMTSLRLIVLILLFALCIAQEGGGGGGLRRKKSQKATTDTQGEHFVNHSKGYCIWYDQCTTGNRPLNCFYNGRAKNLTDPEGVQILNSLCPELTGQRTCCSTQQLVALHKNLRTMLELTNRCSACWNNIRRLYCQLTCSRDQSLFMNPNFVIPVSEGKEAVVSVEYFVSSQFKQGLFESCKDLTLEGYTDIKLFCGTMGRWCTTKSLIRYMQSAGSGLAPYTFNIYFPDVLPRKLSWMNETTFKCNKPFIDPQSNKTASLCSCQDCVGSCPRRLEQLIITSTHPTPTGYHRYGDEEWIPFGPIFHLDLLNQALDLQDSITKFKVSFGDSSITFEDICFKTKGHQPFAPNTTEQCEIESVFQYFQNNKTKLNKCLTSMGYDCNDPNITDFFAADFHDHLLACTRFPSSVTENKLKEPCISVFGGAIDPKLVLDGFPNDAYENATTLIITFAVNNYKDESKLAEVITWEKAFKEFMADYINNASHANLTISYLTPEMNCNDVEVQFDLGA